MIGRGSLDGHCEVLPDKACIWVNVYEHARAANRVDGLIVFIPPRNRDLQGTSSFINLFLNRDSRPGNAQADPDQSGTRAASRGRRRWCLDAAAARSSSATLASNSSISIALEAWFRMLSAARTRVDAGVSKGAEVYFTHA